MNNSEVCGNGESHVSVQYLDRAMSGFVANDPVSFGSFQPSEAATNSGSLRLLHDHATVLGTGIDGAGKWCQGKMVSVCKILTDDNATQSRC